MAALDLARPPQTLAQNTPKQASTMVHVKLPYDIEISLPAGWVLEDAASNKVRTDRATRILDLANIPTGPGGALLTASPDGHLDRTSVIVSVIMRPSASQAQVAALDLPQLEQVNAQHKADLEAGMAVEGSEMVNWFGCDRVRLGSLFSLVCRYAYRMPGRQPRTMESHRIFLGGGSVGFMLQAPVEEFGSRERDFAPIRASFRASTLP